MTHLAEMEIVHLRPRVKQLNISGLGKSKWSEVVTLMTLGIISANREFRNHNLPLERKRIFYILKNLPSFKKVLSKSEGRVLSGK